MNRVKPYDVPHKGLRNALSQLSFVAGKTDYTNFQEIEKLYLLGKDVFLLLEVHAADENEILLSELKKYANEAAKHDILDHEGLHLEQVELRDLLSRIYFNAKNKQHVVSLGKEFYLAFSEFHGKYLEHCAEEERITQPLLWMYFTDEELSEHRVKVLSRNTQTSILTWFKYVIPAQNRMERIGLLAGFKKLASPTFFNEAMEIIGAVIPADEFHALEEALWLKAEIAS